MNFFFLFSIVFVLNLLVSWELFISLVLVLLLAYVSKMNMTSDYEEALSLNQSYECGFEYSLKGCGFSLQFYVISFSFLLFDLEICLFTPLLVSMQQSVLSLFTGLMFLVIVFFIFLYELTVSAFNW